MTTTGEGFWVYILENGQHRYYIGHTSDLNGRVNEHNSGASRATRGRGPWRLAYTEECGTRSAAMRRERQIKSMKSRLYIQQLIEQAREKYIGA